MTRQQAIRDMIIMFTGKAPPFPIRVTQLRNLSDDKYEELQFWPPPLNVNIVVNALVEREEPGKWEAQLRTLLQIQREAGEQQVALFKLNRDAIIEAKERDPDYIDKRANNRSRRVLRYCVGASIFAGIIALVALALPGLRS